MKQTTPIDIAFILLTVVFTVLGQLLIKKGMIAVGTAPGQFSLWPEFLLRAFTNLMVLGGLASAVIAAVFWILALSRSELSFAYPFMGLAIVLTLALTPLLFGQAISPLRWAGVLIVCVGLWIAAQG